MTNYLTDDPNAQWPSGVPVISTDDPVLGGETGEHGPVNVPHQRLNERILFLRAHSAASADLAAHVQDGGAHGATSEAAPGAIARRDAGGRAKVAAPGADGDAANKKYVDDKCRALEGGVSQADFGAHVDASAAHNATSLATADRIVRRDAAGKAQAATPVAADPDATLATKGYVLANMGAGPAGTAFWGWSTAGNLTNISSVSGSKAGDYFVNTGTATRTILGVSTAVGGVVKSTSATAGTAAGSIRGAEGAQGPQGQAGETGAAGAAGTAFWGWSTAGNLTNISSVSGSKAGDYFVNTGAETRTILGVSTPPGGVVKSSSTSATAGTAAGSIRGAEGPQGPQGAQGPQGQTGAAGARGTGFHGVSADVTDLRSIADAQVGDFLVNTDRVARHVLETEAAPGDVVKAATWQQGIWVGNIRGPEGGGGGDVPDASTSVKGKVALATNAEAAAGADAAKAVTPAALHAGYAIKRHDHAAGDIASGTIPPARLPLAATGWTGGHSIGSGPDDFVATPGFLAQAYSPAGHAHDAAAVSSGVIAPERLPLAGASWTETLTGTGGRPHSDAAEWAATPEYVGATCSPLGHTHGAADLDGGTIAPALLPAATTSAAGAVRLATPQETIGGTWIDKTANFTSGATPGCYYRNAHATASIQLLNVPGVAPGDAVLATSATTGALIDLTPANALSEARAVTPRGVYAATSDLIANIAVV